MTNQPFPGLNSKITAKDGVVTPVWRAFFQTVWERTGGSIQALYAALNGDAFQRFKAAPAVASDEVVTLGQGVTLYQPKGDYAALAGSASQVFSVAPAVSGANAPQYQQVTDALALKADLASPALTGIPTAPTAIAGTSTTQIATTAFVTGAITPASWGSITGTLSAQTDLNSALAGKIGQAGHYLIPASGEDMATAMTSALLVTQSYSVDNMLIFPFYLPKSVAISGVKCNIQTALAGGTVKIVVYDSDANDRPNAKLGETATISAAATGFQSSSLALSLTGGKTYWFGMRFSVSIGIYCWPVAATPYINGGTASTGNKKSAYRLLTYATAAPSTWGWNSSEITSNNCPAIWLTVA